MRNVSWNEILMHFGIGGEIRHAKFSTIRQLLEMKMPVYLCGPAGSGKNVTCQQLADSMGIEFFYTNCVTQEHKLTGFIDANGLYHETEFYKAFKYGGLLMFDELDGSSPEATLLLNAALANGYFEFPTGRITQHENFRVVAAGNTCGTGATNEYVGRAQLDAATLDRFAFVEFDYDEKVEEIISNRDQQILEFVRNARKAAKKYNMDGLILGYRAMERLSKMKVFSPMEALSMAIIKGQEIDLVNELADELTMMGLAQNKYVQALRLMELKKQL
jgi:MoxR-like ATPase